MICRSPHGDGQHARARRVVRSRRRLPLARQHAPHAREAAGRERQSRGDQKNARFEKRESLGAADLEESPHHSRRKSRAMPRTPRHA